MTATEFRNNADMFTKAYLEAALWSSTDDDGEALDSNFDIEQVAESTLDRMVADCEKFQREQAAYIIDESYKYQRQHSIEILVGHVFWFNRSGAGAGFWDWAWTEPAATALSNAAKAFGTIELYVGDDGLIHV